MPNEKGNFVVCLCSKEEQERFGRISLEIEKKLKTLLISIKKAPLSTEIVLDTSGNVFIVLSYHLKDGVSYLRKEEKKIDMENDFPEDIIVSNIMRAIESSLNSFWLEIQEVGARMSITAINYLA